MPTKEEINAMHQATQLAKIATGENIVRQYLSDRDRSFARRVASAIVNDLTGGINLDPAFKRFEMENAGLIADIVTKLRDDDELKDIITQTVGVITTIMIATGDASTMADPGKRLEHLRELGLITEGKNPCPETYLPFVTAYCKKYIPDMGSRQKTSSLPSGGGCASMLILLLTIPVTLIVFVTTVLE